MPSANANRQAPELPLHGLRVLDLSTVVAGPYGAEMFGELGADVIRIEPVGASASPAPAANAPISESEGFLWALQKNKRAICMDLKHPEGLALFMDLVRQSDVVWDNFRPGVTERLGIDYAKLKAINPRIITCAISGYGSEGPWSRVGAYDITVQALSGVMSITGSGEPGSEPARWGVPIGDIAGALYGVIGVLAAVEERSRTGVGQNVEIALLDVQLALNCYRVPQVFGTNIDFAPASPRKGGAGTVPYGPFRCGDGKWVSIGPSSNFWGAFCQVMGHPELEKDPRFATIGDRQKNQPALDALLETIFLERPSAEWEAGLFAAQIPFGPVLDIAGAFAHPQAAARGMRVDLQNNAGRRAPVAGTPLRFEGEATRAQHPPALSGTDTAAVLKELAALDDARIGDLAAKGIIGARQVAGQRPSRTANQAQGSAATNTVSALVAGLARRPGPLNGVLVLEMCGDEPAGTMGTQMLADLGATVIKLERIGKDGAPTQPVSPVPEPLAYYWGMNRNKLSLSLDLKSDAGRQLLHQLAAKADVIYDNFRPEVMKRMGADPATLKGINPALICCSVTGFGRSGPLAGFPAYDATIQAMGGGMSITGLADPAAIPVRCGNPIGGIAGALYGVAGTLAALARRRRTAQGAALDVALFDAQLAMNAYRVPPALGAGKQYGPEPHRGGSGALPYGPFKARCGRWFVLGITSQFWDKACKLMGKPEWIKDPRFLTEADRQQHEPALNEAVGAVIVTRDADDWEKDFIAAGIPGATVKSIKEAFDHPHVALRHMLVGFDHPIGSQLKVAGDPMKLSAHPHQPFAPAPGLGEHTPLVLAQLLDMPQQDIARLRAAGAVWWPAEGRSYARPSVV